MEPALSPVSRRTWSMTSNLAERMEPVPQNETYTPRNCARRIGAARRGLTLIEILIVIAILLAIGALVVVNLMPAREHADIDLTRVQIDQMTSALDRFRVDLRRYPTEDEGLAALWNREALEEERDQQNWRGPYIDPIRTDPWGNAYVYRFPSEIRDSEQHFDIISFGPDGEEGTDDDITNHDRLRGEDGEIERFDDFDF
jgi:general secretion pathway protein G